MWRKKERKWQRGEIAAGLSLLPDRGRGQEVQDGLLHAGVRTAAAAAAAAGANPSLPLLVVLLHKSLGEQLPLNGLQFVLLQAERDGAEEVITYITTTARRLTQTTFPRHRTRLAGYES